MAEMKECFGQLANMSIRYRNQSKAHHLRIDEEKLRECDSCKLFTKCMFLKYNDLVRDLIKRLDEVASKKDGGQL